MNDKCKYCNYLSKCPEKVEFNSVMCHINRSFPKVVEKSYEDILKENKRLLELCMYALISSTKIYNHELANDTKQAFIKIIKENLNDDTSTLRNKIEKHWNGDKQ